METVRLRLAEEMVKTRARLEALGTKPWLVPQAGTFLWCRLPRGIDAATIAWSCLKNGVVLAPGNAFSQSLSASDSCASMSRNVPMTGFSMSWRQPCPNGRHPDLACRLVGPRGQR